VHLVNRISRRTAALVTLLAATLAFVPAAASAHGSTTYGSTALQLDPGTAQALTSVGVTPGIVGPAFAAGDGINFPITDRLLTAAGTGYVTHSGGITLTAGSTTVSLTDFTVGIYAHTLSGIVNGGARAQLATLDFGKARIGFSGGCLTIGPVTASLTKTATDALNAAFGLAGTANALQPGTVLGTATVKYAL
jgi:hypothetical protein